MLVDRYVVIFVMFILTLSPFGAIVLGSYDTSDRTAVTTPDPEVDVQNLKSSCFIENKGQWDETLLFIGETSFGHIGLGRDGVYYDIFDRTSSLTISYPNGMPGIKGEPPMANPRAGCVLKYRFVGAGTPQVRGEGEMPHSTNYFLGDDETRWASNVKSYSRVVYYDLWDDVDMAFYFDGSGPKYDLILGDEACVDDIIVRVEGQSSMSMNGQSIEIEGPGPLSLSDTGLKAYEWGTLKDVQVSYRMLSADTFGFSIPEGSRGTPIVIDPLLVSTYLGGVNMDYGYSVGTDTDGNIIVFGWTYSSDFPITPGAYDDSLGGSGDIFVSMLDWTGSSLVYSSYIGGSGYDYYLYYGGMVVMDDGILVSCITSSSDYPTTADCYDSTLTGSYDSAFTKLSLDGTALLASSYFGGSSYEYIYDVASSSDGGFYLLGSTYSSDLPVTSGAYQSTMSGTSDCFVSRFGADGKTLTASTFLGGSSADYPQRIRENGNGDIVVSGNAYSSDFPVKTGCYDTTYNGGTGDCFVSVLEGDCKSLIASTFIGGSGSDVPHGMAIDQNDNVLLFGFTTSSGFPTTSGVVHEDYLGGGDAFVTVLDPTLVDVLHSSFFGGTGDDSPVSIDKDAMGNVVISGSTASDDLQTTEDAEDRSYNGYQDFFAAILSEDLSELSYSTYFGGSGYESGGELSIDPLGKIVVAGRTNSTDMEVTDEAYQKVKEGSSYYNDVYVFAIEHFTTSEPLSVDSVRTYTDINCTAESLAFDIGEKVFIELRGTDSNGSRRDGAMVNVSLLPDMDLVMGKVLVETEKDSGAYRGSFTVPPGSIYLDKLRVSSKKDPSRSADITIDYPFRPSMVMALTVHEEMGSTATLDKADLNQTVYFKALGLDSNPLTRDKAFVRLTSDRDPTFSRMVILLETDQSSGLYWGQFIVPETRAYLENLTATSLETPARTVVIMVHTPVKLRCSIDPSIAIEDGLYEARFWNFGYNPVSWSVTENAYWLTWDPEGKRLFGTPANLEVGPTDVIMSIWDEEGHSDDWSFQVTVVNVPPRVLTENVLTAMEDEEYSVRYESDDDVGGRTSWFLTTNAPFLSLNKNTGELKGRPINEDVGSYFVMIEVQDGNGGTTNLRFNLTVVNTNDRPMITTVDIKTVMQDDRFVRDYEAMDDDLNDTQYWELRTDALWLTLDNHTGILTGEPKAEDVGHHTVNLTVIDSGGLSDSREFTLEVLDKKDRPTFVSIPPFTEVLHGSRFRFDVNASDPDKDDTLEYSISKCDPPSDISIDPVTGLIDWVATVRFLTEAKDRYKVTLKVSDGELFSTADFELKVVPTLSPSSSILAPLDGQRSPSGHTLLEWSGSDPEDEDLTYTVYLHQTKSMVTGRDEGAVHALDISVENINVTGLVQGATYYWTVVPYDGCTFGSCTSGTFSFRVNNRPVLEQMDRRTAKAGTTVRINIRGSDLDGEDVLSYSLTSAPEGMVIDSSTGSLTWTPEDPQVGESIVKVRATDGVETTDMTFYIVVEEGGGLDPTMIAIIAGFSILVFIIIVLVLFIVLKVRKMAPEEEKGHKEDADQIAKEIEELRMERGWEEDHATGGGDSKAVTISLENEPPVPTSPLEAHLHDKDHAKPTYEDLYGPKVPEESEERLDKVLKEGLEEMEEEEPEESWE